MSSLRQRLRCHWQRARRFLGGLNTVWVAPGFHCPDRFSDPFDFAAHSEGETYRDLAGRRTYRVELDGRGYFVKYHSGVGWQEIIKNLLVFRVPVVSAAVEYKAVELLTLQGVGTMRVVAYGRRGWNPAAVESFLVTDELAGTKSLEEMVLEGRISSLQLKRRLIRQVAEMTGAMHRAGMNHRDLYLCHFLLDIGGLSGGDVRLSLIDLHRAQFWRKMPVRWRNKDLASLYFSALGANLSTGDKLRFLSVYFQKPVRQVLMTEARSLRWLEGEARRLQAKFLRKYAQ